MKPLLKLTVTFAASSLAIASVFAFSLTANAQENNTYFSVSGGLTSLQSSNNSGELTSPFTTGEGTTIPGGAVLASGTSVSWNTLFKSGYNAGIAIGKSYDNGLRGELEIRYLSNSISSHNGVAVGGSAIGTEDAGVLITGSGNLGASVSTIVGAGTGKNSTLAYMINGYYDFMPEAEFTPYVGVGVGYADTTVVFAPSDVAVADSGNGGLAYQGILGGLYNVSENTSVFAEYRYFGRSKVRVDLSLLPGYLDTDNKAHLFNVGLRVNF
ncbi:MAG: outer membrane beta-barrel protein [Emcibacteraceae bacterium]|nr:outer membrane beta-barrel protein [Emcibacteraceae bacterium]